MPRNAVQAEGLVKHYGEVKALDGLDLVVPEGSVVGLLGPNGAGKTTCVRILTTLLRADAGHATVDGIDVAKHPDQVRRVIGLTGQYAAVDEYLTGRENLDMVGRLYHLPPAWVRDRAQELLERFDLADAGDRPLKTYSGGMRRRLDLRRLPRGEAPDPVPRRADHRPGPAVAAGAVGASSTTSSPTAPPCCSPRSTSRRPTSSPRTSS